MGVINKICEDGAGISNMNKIIRLDKLELEKKKSLSNISNKVSRKELFEIVDVWIDQSF